MIITDLDGTLLNSDHQLSYQNRKTLIELGQEGHTRVVATGRVLHSAKKVLNNKFPIDYLIFSSGTGIINFKTGVLLKKSSLNREGLETSIKLLTQMRISFMIHAEAPENHYCQYQRSPSADNKDFDDRLKIYQDFGKSLQMSLPPQEASIIVISSTSIKSEDLYLELKNTLTSVHVTRCSSPLNNQYSWIEIIPKQTSKASASAWLKDHLNLERKTLGIGNDYNDLDLLNWADQSFVVGNAPEPLKEKFQVVASNNDHGFSEAIALYKKIT